MGPIPVQNWYQLQFVTRLPVDMNSAVVLEAEILDMYAVKLISFKTLPEVAIFQFSCVTFACEEFMRSSCMRRILSQALCAMVTTCGSSVESRAIGHAVTCSANLQASTF